MILKPNFRFWLFVCIIAILGLAQSSCNVLKKSKCKECPVFSQQNSMPEPNHTATI